MSDFSQYILCDSGINMTAEEFIANYDAPQIILKKQNGYTMAPGADFINKTSRDETDKYSIDDFNMNAYYNTLNYSYLWGSTSDISLYLALNSEYNRTNEYQYVYVIYPAKDNTKNIDVVIQFEFYVEK